MRYLTDTEILNWNDKISLGPYMLRPRYTNRSSNVDIVFTQKVKNGSSPAGLNGYNQSYDLVDTTDPSISFRYIFSIASNRSKEFWDIFDRRKKISIGTKTNYNDNFADIVFSEIVVSSKENVNHKINEKEFTRYMYNFTGKLSSIISYITAIEDSIKFFEKIWGYDEDGKEYCLLAYPLGFICSKTDDKSSDYLVLDYEYSISSFAKTVIVGGDYNINYRICKMEWTDKSATVKYGEVKTVNEKELCYSRNSRIDDILN